MSTHISKGAGGDLGRDYQVAKLNNASCYSPITWETKASLVEGYVMIEDERSQVAQPPLAGGKRTSVRLTTLYRVNFVALSGRYCPSRHGYRVDVFGRSGSITASADGVIISAPFRGKVEAASIPYFVQGPRPGLQLSSPSPEASTAWGMKWSFSHMEY
ncbi:hypothetical protein BU16DRAFT_183306 [Lophium mytilinum]|uniref:Uncharacterized protein n=1 Tax=Lophium mytilinum TaxID=390894 RepID=A0A6A6QBQ1_9PEZI|nr:hypothetical protein BU16DRAFT_183306 [Lophium mytilinum]